MTTFAQPFSLTAALVNATGFSIKNGQVIDPRGNVHVAKGVNVYGWDNTMMSVCSNNASGGKIVGWPLTTLFPGVNHVRVQAGPTSNNGTAGAVYQAPSLFQTFVTQLTGYTLSGSTWAPTPGATQNIVVEIEDHDNNLLQAPYTGAALTTQTNAYATWAAYYATNPYVWFGTQNEMNTGDLTYSTSAFAAMSASHLAIYNAVRGQSNAVLQIMAGAGGSNPGTVGAGAGYVASDYLGMTNIVWELHCYMTGNTPDPWGGTYYSGAQGYVAGGTSAPNTGAGGGWGIIGAQTLRSADGVVPVIVGEWGPGGDGGNPGTTEAAPLVTEIQSVQAQSVGATAWGYYPAGVDGGNWDLVNAGYTTTPSLTTWGGQVAAII
jgi:hypothetical protein